MHMENAGHVETALKVLTKHGNRKSGLPRTVGGKNENLRRPIK